MNAALGLMLVVLAQQPPPVRLASPTWRFVGLEEKRGEFFSDYLAQQVSLQPGMRVTTAAEIASLLGFERQKQLLGCAEESCVAELAGALGVDALILGSLAQIGTSLVVNIKVVKATDGAQLAVLSHRVATEEALLDLLPRLARQLTQQVRANLGSSAPRQDPVAVTPPPKPDPKPKPALTPPPDRTPAPLAAAPVRSPRSHAWIPAVAGGAALVGGTVAWTMGLGTAEAIRTGDEIRNAAELQAAMDAGQVQRAVAYTLVPLGVAALGAAAWMAMAPGAPASLTVSPVAGGAVVVWTGVAP